MENVELLRPLLAQGLLSIDKVNTTFDFKAWISSGRYQVVSAPTPNTIELSTTDSAFYRMLCYDSCRFASAAFESASGVRSVSNFPKAFAWMAIQAYYAAFFGAHSIMRCFGTSCSQLERGHITLLKSHASLVSVGYTAPEVAGFNTAVYDRNANSITIEKKGNTHEDTWACFRDCLKNCSSELLNLSIGRSIDKQALSAKLDALVDRLENNGNAPRGNYLSRFRNAVNYRQEFDAWYPYGRGVKSDRVLDVLKQWSADKVVPHSAWKGSPEAYLFFLSCTEIVSLCRSLILMVSRNAQSNKNPFSHWPIKFLNLSHTAA